MTAFDDVMFPLLVIAQAERRSGIALFSRPLQLDLAQCTKKSAIDARLGPVAPRTVFVTHATRWHCVPRRILIERLSQRVPAIPVARACEFLGCDPTVQDAAARAIDAYPPLERRLAPVIRAIGRPDTVRNTQPLVAAMIVAHAASVAHLMKHG